MSDATPSFLKLTLRDLLFLIVIAGLILALFVKSNQQQVAEPSSRALKTVSGSLEISYWQTKGNKGWGNRNWEAATRIEFFDHYILITKSDSSKLLPRENLEYFLWHSTDEANKPGKAQSAH